MEASIQNAQAQPMVHIGNLSFKTTSYELQTLFSEVAPALRVTLALKKDNVSAFAFVTFSSIEDCQKIIKEFNYYTLHNKQMNITMLVADKNLPADGNIFVKNLPPNMNSKDLSEVFKMFGSIASCKVASNANGELKGYGFVQFKSAKSARKAIENCKNVRIGSHVVEVELYNAKLRENKISQAAQTTAFTNCYIRNFPANYTEAELRALLEKYGAVNSLYFPLKENGASVGYACANFASPESAAAAVKGLHNQDLFQDDDATKEYGITSMPFYIQRAENKKDRMESLKRQIEMMSFDGQRSKCNLYVANIPDSFSKDEIKSIFMKFGRITGFKIASSGLNSNKQYGYICYATPEEACVAFENIDGTFMDGNKLQISYYKTKYERVLENEAAVSAGGYAAAQPEAAGASIMQSLFSTVLGVAKTYKESWGEFGVQNEVEFAQKVTRGLADLPMQLLNEMLQEKGILDDHIRRIVKSKKSLQNRVRLTSN